MVNSERGRVYFRSKFWSFQGMLSWPCCFWSCGKTVPHGRRLCAEERQGVRVPLSPLRICLQQHKTSCYAPPLKGFYSHSVTLSGDSALNTWAFGENSRYKLQQNLRLTLITMSKGLAWEEHFSLILFYIPLGMFVHLCIPPISC